MNTVINDLSQQLTDLRIGLAAETAYTEFWHWFCDEAIEQVKNQQLSPTLVRTALTTWLKLLQPFAPFVTEAIWQQIHTDSSTLVALSPWPSKV